MYKQPGPKVANLDSIESTDKFMAAVGRINPRYGIKGIGQKKKHNSPDQKKEHNSLDRILAIQRAPADRTGLGYALESSVSGDWDVPQPIPSSVPYRTKEGWYVPPVEEEAIINKSAGSSIAFSESQRLAQNAAQNLLLSSNVRNDTWDSAPAPKIENSTSAAHVQKSSLSVSNPKPELATDSSGFPVPDSSGWDDVPPPCGSGGDWGASVNSPSKPQGTQSKRYIAPHLRHNFVSAGTKLEPPAPKTVDITLRQNSAVPPVKVAKLVSTEAKRSPPAEKAVDPTSGQDASAPLPLKAENVSPDLTTYRIPHPNRDFKGSEDSLPDTVSTIAISDTGVQELAGAHDVRNRIALERDVHLDNRGKFYQTNWAKNYRDFRNDDEYFETLCYLEPFITAWMGGIPENVKPRFLQDDVPRHWKSDVDTNTGLLVEPVHFPETIIGDNSALKGEEDWRRRNWSSNLLIHRRLTDLHKYRKRKGYKDEGRQLAYKPGKVEEYVKPESQPAAVEEEEHPLPLHDPGVPKIPAFLRPAEMVDMKAVSLIYEAEMKSGFQVVDSEPPTPKDWERVLQTSRELSMPFIVAVYGSARRCGLREGNLQWSDEPQVPYNEHEAASQGLTKGQILGFAYAGVWQPGVAGSGQGTSRYTAKLHAWVDPKHRRNKLGLGLIDRLLACMSPTHNPRTGIDFVDIHNSPIYHKLKDDEVKGTPEEEEKKKEAIRNRPRKYYNIQISYKFKHRPRWQLAKPDQYPNLKDHVKDLVWVKSLLEEKLPFIKLVTFEAVHRSSKLREPREEDENKKVFWLDEFVWEYNCVWGVPDTEDGY
ncbi:hypothetical protein B0T21DRAFT_410575 [Apiosordaria backusii]|uniref:Uncharacterized protein n=1 Tax=Apiosordaria backusii TaxID=314023 RepID=A0AA40BMZ7_9PEZI|nr:hypothetical protein B0T21DRAFT_410575 [Apiosordaria backusii]